ncbi:MAG: septum site-determining protein MinC [Defluviitaleaceae bacterium]|nr:septum site-determining protein MinC [Defluviitaleaceae bacterium]
MAAKQIVTLKGQKDGISIILDEAANFDDIQASLRKKVSQGRKFFDGADTKVSFKGRELDDLHEKTLIDIITEETSLDITFVQGEGFVSSTGSTSMFVRDASGDTNLPTTHFAAYAPTSAYVHAKQARKESTTAYYHGALRSGQVIKYKGSVVIMGDVNPGSEVIADGNVIVLGALKGMAHAGASGDDTCFVSALFLQPTQLRIAGTISHVPSAIKILKRKAGNSTAAYAYIKDGQVFIGQL